MRITTPKRRLLTVLATAFAALALVACGGDDNGDSGTTVPGTIDTGSVPTDVTVPTNVPEGVPTTPEEAQKVAECIKNAAGDQDKIRDCLGQ